MIPVAYFIDHINRYVSDVDKFIEFYSSALDYELIGKGRKADGSRYAIMKGSGHELFISEKRGFREQNENFRHIGYSIGDVDKKLAGLKEKGYAGHEQEIIVKPFSRQFYIKDPDGFEIDLIQWTDKEGFYEECLLSIDLSGTKPDNTI